MTLLVFGLYTFFLKVSLSEKHPLSDRVLLSHAMPDHAEGVKEDAQGFRDENVLISGITA
jgi:hypothetical protein